MNEQYTKRDIFDSIESLIQDSTTQAYFLSTLAKTKIKRLEKEYEEARVLYITKHKPLIEENENKEPRDYTVSVKEVSEINKNNKKMSNLLKQINFYSKQIHQYDEAINNKRTDKIIKTLYKQFDFIADGSDFNKYLAKK